MYAEITPHHRIWRLAIVPAVMLVCIVAAQWATMQSADARSYRTLTQAECTALDTYLNNLGWSGGLDRVQWSNGVCNIWAGNTKAPRQRIADLGLLPTSLGGSAPGGWGRPCADNYGSFPAFQNRQARSARSVSQQSSPPAAAAPKARSARSVSQQSSAPAAAAPPARSAPRPSATPGWARNLDCSSIDWENSPSGLIISHCRAALLEQASQAEESAPPAAAPPQSDPPQAQEAAKQEAAKQEAAKQEAAKQEAAKQEAAKQEAAKQEAAKQEAAKQEAAKQEAAKQEAAKQEASSAAPSSSVRSGARNINCAGVNLETNPSGIIVNYCRNQQ